MPNPNLLTTSFNDADGDKVSNKLWADSTATNQELADIVDAMKALTDLGMSKYIKGTSTDIVGKSAVARDATHPFADRKAKVSLVYNTANPNEYVRMSIPGPIAGLNTEPNFAVDPAYGPVAALTAALVAAGTSHTGSAITTLKEGKLVIPS